MDPTLNVFVASLVIGLVLLALEVFVPGGILGVFGVMALMVAMGAGFFAFGPQNGLLAALLVIVFGGVVFAVWIRIFPRTPMGKALTLKKDGETFKSADTGPAFSVGLEGLAHTHLRPSGIAVLAGQRLDVVAESGFINAGSPIKIVHIEGNRVVVRALPG